MWSEQVRFAALRIARLEDTSKRVNGAEQVAGEY